MNNRIGVIVPIYNVEGYIVECIESILAQTYTNFRLILVDDGTPDNAGKICDEYAKKDSRITVIHQENTGVTRARARGVEEASDCEFIMFVDSDDTISDNALELFLLQMRYDTDIVVGHFWPFKNLITDQIPIEKYRYYLLTELYISPGPVCKLFKRALFNDFTFDIPRSVVIAEDVIMNIRLSFNTEKEIRYLQKETYNYRIYETSTYNSHTRTPENEQIIQDYRIKSIPTDRIDEFINATIKIRLLRSREFWGYKYMVNGMKKTDFHKQLLSDIKKYNYRMPFIDTVIFRYSNPIIRFFAINIKKLINKLKV